MIDIRECEAVIEMINAALTANNKVEIKREKGELAVVGINERRKLFGKIKLKAKID
jgi:hypothetical protein